MVWSKQASQISEIFCAIRARLPLFTRCVLSQKAMHKATCRPGLHPIRSRKNTVQTLINEPREVLPALSISPIGLCIARQHRWKTFSQPTPCR